LRLNVKHMCCSHQGVLVGPTCLTAVFPCSGHHTGRPPSRIWPFSAQQCLHSDANLRDHLVDALTEELEVLECTFERVAGHRSQASWWTVGCSCPGRQTWQLAGTLDDPDSYGLLPTNLPRICVPLQMRIRIPQALQEHQPDGPVSTRNDGRAACLLQSSARTPRRARTPRLQCNSFQWCTALQPGCPRARAPTTSAAWYKPQVAMCSLRHVQPTICTREKQSRGGTRAGLQCPPAAGHTGRPPYQLQIHHIFILGNQTTMDPKLIWWTACVACCRGALQSSARMQTIQRPVQYPSASQRLSTKGWGHRHPAWCLRCWGQV